MTDSPTFIEDMCTHTHTHTHTHHTDGADFGRMTDSPSFIEDVLHKALIEVECVLLL